MMKAKEVIKLIEKNGWLLKGRQVATKYSNMQPKKALS